MKKIILFFAFVACLNIAAFSYENTYAVIVGVSDYEDDGLDLNFAAKDARCFYNFLMSEAGGSVPAENICLLLDSDATRANMIARSKELFSKAKKRDRAIFFFSGHGSTGYFLPTDYSYWENTKFTYSDLKSVFRCAKCNTKLIFADACKSGALRGSRDASDEDNLVLKDYNIAVMLSCKADEYSLEIAGEGINQGLFTYYLIKGLSGEANRDSSNYITIQELYYYVYRMVAEKADSKGCAQHPDIFGRFNLKLIVGKVL